MAARGFFKEGTLTAGEGVGGSTQPPCRGRRPDAPAGAARFSINVRRIRKRLPYNEMLRIRRGGVENRGLAARRAGVGAPYNVDGADSPYGLLRFCAAARNAGDGVPYRAFADSPKVGNIVAAAAGARLRPVRRPPCEAGLVFRPVR